MERTNIFCQVVFKHLLDVAHHPDDFPSMFSETQCCWRRYQPFSTPYEEFRLKFLSQVMELETDGARRQVNLFRRAGHAGGVHDREEQFELVNIHLPAPISARCAQGPDSAIL